MTMTMTHNNDSDHKKVQSCVDFRMTTNPTIAGGLLEDWVLQLEVLHDAAGTQVKVLLHNLVQLLQEVLL